MAHSIGDNEINELVEGRKTWHEVERIKFKPLTHDEIKENLEFRKGGW